VKAGQPSEPFLFSGFAKRSLHLAQGGAEPVSCLLEVDERGDGAWRRLREITVPARGSAWMEFAPAETGAWLRLLAIRDMPQATAFFHGRAEDARGAQAAPIFAGIAQAEDRRIHGGLLHARGGDLKTLRFLARDESGDLGCYDLDGQLRLNRTNDPAGAAWTARAVALPPPLITVDAASVLYVDDQGQRWRLPKGDAALDQPGPLGPGRVCREVCTERNLLNVHGTFYELPAENAGGIIKLRPIATHNRRIHDFASYRGLLVISGVADGARHERIVRSGDGKCALWVGAVDDLWAFGKPRGRVGAWRETPVKAGQPSDACLATGYDRKRLALSHTLAKPVGFRIEADFTGAGTWASFTRVTAEPGWETEYRFPESFGAYWVRLVADADATVTATFVYE
jgi:hypothetical protein